MIMKESSWGAHKKFVLARPFLIWKWIMLVLKRQPFYSFTVIVNLIMNGERANITCLVHSFLHLLDLFCSVSIVVNWKKTQLKTSFIYKISK